MNFTRLLIVFVAPLLETFWLKLHIAPHWPLALLFVLLLPVNIVLYFTWIVEIRGRFLTPLRHLPTPKVSPSTPSGHKGNIIKILTIIQRMELTPSSALRWI